MTNKVDKKIVGYKVLTEENTKPNENNIHLEVFGEDTKRPEALRGSTYKIKTPQSEHALYVTINDFALNKDTEHEQLRPFEIFINSKNMDHYQWVVALTRLVSAIFRKGGNATFLVDEMKAVVDPNGGYYKKGGVWMPSLVAEIGYVIEAHMKHIGMIVVEAMPTYQKEFIEAKKAEFEAANGESDSSFPEKATLCKQCSVKAVVLLDGCKTCLNCSDSKCG